MNRARLLYPTIDFDKLDYAKILPGAYMVAIDIKNGKLSKMNNKGELTTMEGEPGPKGDPGENGQANFYFEEDPPELTQDEVGARWISDGIEYVWVYDGESCLWMQPAQIGKAQYGTTEINIGSYITSFMFEYYGVTYKEDVCTVTLPVGLTPEDDGKIIIIADETGSVEEEGRGILIAASGSQKIDGETTIFVNENYKSVTLLFRKGGWKKIN
jgi:hypothetical protein